MRARRPEDLATLMPLLERTHRERGYPVRPTSVRADWLATDDERASWVAELGSRVVGHVALHPAGDGPCAPLWRAATGRDLADLAVVGRLLSDAPGAGTLLLTHAVAAARALGCEPVLTVDATSPAHAFYLRRGWVPAGEADEVWGRAAAMVLRPPPAPRPARR